MSFGSGVLGGLAVAASLVTEPDFKKPAGYLVAAVAVPYLIGITIAYLAFCGWN